MKLMLKCVLIVFMNTKCPVTRRFFWGRILFEGLVPGSFCSNNVTFEGGVEPFGSEAPPLSPQVH